MKAHTLLMKLSDDLRSLEYIPLKWRLVAFIARLKRRRNVLFLHNSYYHYYYLAAALRKRGWNAVTVSYEDPLNGLNKNFYHGEDINIYSSDPEIFQQRIKILHQWARKYFDMLHFSGDGTMSFYATNWYVDDPEDIIDWKKRGKKLGYTISGCKSCISQTSFSAWSKLDAHKPACDSCRWQMVPTVCSDETNLEWGMKVSTYCDLICAEATPALDYMASDKTVFNPLTMCLDPEFWKPELPIPEQFRILRTEGEFLIYHGVGNYEARLKEDGRNIKGTAAVIAVVDRLKSEGINVRMLFATNLKNQEVRYLQAQVDVIVDQLIVGEYGATAREGMMLGKPVICYLNLKGNENHHYDMQWKKEVPLVSATEETVYSVLKDLLVNPDKRRKIGIDSRKYALKWHSADACAERYEMVYDKLIPRR
jgi:hypothetical protein